MAKIVVEWDDRGLERFREALGSHRLHGALRRALNRAGDRARTQVRRSVAKQMGLPQKRVREDIETDRADYSELSYSITGERRFVPLADFKARQRRRGVSAAPWGDRRIFRGTFLRAGNVFRRVGASPYPIDPLWGGSVHREMIRDETPETFEEVASAELRKRIAHELRRLMGS